VHLFGFIINKRDSICNLCPNCINKYR